MQLIAQGLLAADPSGQGDVDLLTLTKRMNNIGKIYYDRDNLLKQVALNQQDDLFIDDEPPQPQEEVPAEIEQ